MIKVYNYTDYRKFLEDYYSNKKASGIKFNYRKLAQAVGFKSAGHFTQIIQGKANISRKLIEKFIAGLQLRKREAQYFRAMVLYNQAKKHEIKKHNFEIMISFKETAVKVVDVKQYEFYDRWYYAAVRELVEFFPCNESNAALLSRQIVPRITPDQAAKALALLSDLGLIRKNEQGHYRKVDSVLSTGYEAKSVAINNFILSTLDLAKEAIDRFPRKERNLSWMTLSISQKSFDTIQEELRAFRRKALEIAAQDGDANRIYQFNFQIFPLTKTCKERSV